MPREVERSRQAAWLCSWLGALRRRRHTGGRLCFAAMNWSALPRGLFLALVAVASLGFFGQSSDTAAAVSAQARGSSVAFKPLGQDAFVASRLLAVQTLVVVDGARAVPSARLLARRIEQRDGVMESLCTGIIRDADTVAAALRHARQAHISRPSVSEITAAALSAILSRATSDVKKKLDALIKSEGVLVSDMFEMQMLMNHLSQLSEMAASITSATNSAISAMARNVKS